MKEKAMSYLIYPSVVSLAVGLYAFASSHGVSLALGAFGAVVLGALLIAVFEQLLPYQLKWRPQPMIPSLWLSIIPGWWKAVPFVMRHSPSRFSPDFRPLPSRAIITN